MSKIICVANSYKGNERCIAGIESHTAQWIRPISPAGEGAIDFNTRQIKGKEPAILDILEIPIQDHGPNYGCQPENRLLAPGNWTYLGKASPDDILPHCENTLPILHTEDRKIPIAFFNTLPCEDWKSLQLVRSIKTHFFKREWPERTQYMVRFFVNKTRFEFSLTDPVIRGKIASGDQISIDCVLTISLTSPFEGDDMCYKLVAGVIEL